MKRFRITSTCTETFTATVEADSVDDIRRLTDGDIAWEYPATTCDETSADWSVEVVDDLECNDS